jgi:hypothetical protein
LHKLYFLHCLIYKVHPLSSFRFFRSVALERSLIIAGVFENVNTFFEKTSNFFDIFRIPGKTNIMLSFKKRKPQYIEHHILPDPVYDLPISPENVKKIFDGCDDLTTKEVTVGEHVPLFLCWVDGTVSGSDIAELVLRPLTDPVRFGPTCSVEQVQTFLDQGRAYGDDMKRVMTMDELADGLSYGHCAIVMENAAYLFQLKTDQRRTVSEPTVEKAVKGSKDAFVETLRVNTNLVRSRLHTPELKLAQTVVGRKSRTDVAVMWLEGVSAPDLSQEMLRRLDALDVDGLVLPDTLDSGLVDSPRSPFPQLIHTERPDKFAAALLDGRVGVLAEGIPVGFIAPASLPEFLKTNEDRAQHFLAASFTLLLRWICLGITLLLPAFYVAVAMYHAEMIPTKLLLSVIESKQSVPFSSSVEIIGMLIAFELLQEAGLRLPDPVGQTASIIGALIVGQSAVEAQVISPIAVIVVALAGIAGYTMPSLDMGTALRIFRMGLVLAASAAGLFGIVAGLALILWHLCSLESFGTAYVSSALAGQGFAGSRSPFLQKAPWTDVYRDPTINGGDRRRQG